MRRLTSKGTRTPSAPVLQDVMEFTLDRDIVNDIADMVSECLGRKERIEVAALLWSIDSRHRAIPNLKEINSALERLETSTIAREGLVIYVEPSSGSGSARLTAADYDAAISRMNAVLAGNP